MRYGLGESWEARRVWGASNQECLVGNYDPSRRGRMEWQGTLGQMRKHGTRLLLTCNSACPAYSYPTVEDLVARFGADFDLWDRREPCLLCGKQMHYMCSAGPGTPFRPMLSPDRPVSTERLAALGWRLGGAQMANYTLVTTGLDGHQHVTVVEGRSDEEIVEAVKGALTPEHRSASIARGTGDDVEFIGVWDWSEGGPHWTAEE